MRKKFDVSLVVTSKNLSLSDLSALLERPPQTGSHDKDEVHPRGTTWNTTVWRLNANDGNAPCEVQCTQLLSDLPPKLQELLATRVGEIVAILDIAAYFQTAYLSLMIPPVIINDLSVKGIGIEVTAYPTEEPLASLQSVETAAGM
jgi:hypothetical protein